MRVLFASALMILATSATAQQVEPNFEILPGHYCRGKVWEETFFQPIDPQCGMGKRGIRIQLAVDRSTGCLFIYNQASHGYQVLVPYMGSDAKPICRDDLRS